MRSEARLAHELNLGLDLEAVLDQELSRLQKCRGAVLVLCELEGLSYEPQIF
jgi:hypothetical protein